MSGGMASLIGVALGRSHLRTGRRLRLLQDELPGIAKALPRAKILVQYAGAALGGVLI